VGAADRFRCCLGQAEVQHLALGDQVGDSAGGFLDGRVPVDAVLVVQVDVVGAQAPERAFDGGLHVRRGAVGHAGVEGAVDGADRLGFLDLRAQASRSDAFRTLWASHDVREHRTGIKAIHHPVVGDLDLSYEAMGLTSERGLILLAYTAAPGSPSDDALRVLMSWAATHEQEDRIS
jgi:MmyB-like transcription regulator ligand binding domain